MRFWNFIIDKEDVELFINGEITGASFWSDKNTADEFINELLKHKGKDITVNINSPGGDVFVASAIYTALIEHKGKVKIKIDSMAASAASVIAMSGEVHMSPTAIMLIHNPMTMAFGNSKELQSAIDVLDEVKESIMNAYELKSGLDRKEISKLMDKETWMNSRTAIDLGFADYEIISKQSYTPEAIAANYNGKIAIWNCAYKPISEPEPLENNTEFEHAQAILKYVKLKNSI